jgi:hypothetical protein
MSDIRSMTRSGDFSIYQIKNSGPGEASAAAVFNATFC